MRLNCEILLPVALVLSAGWLDCAHGQTPPPSSPNPLMQLMMTQPPIDVDSPVVAAATFDPPAVRPGQKAIYRITLNAIATNVRVPGRLPAPPELEFKPGAQGQILRPVGNTIVPLTSINYEVRCHRPGLFLMPAFYVEVYGRRVLVPAAGLEVATDVEDSVQARQLVVKPASTNLYVGEEFTLQVLLPASPSNTVEAVREVQINGDGLFVDKNSVRQSVGMIEKNGRPVATYIYEATVIPLEAGAVTVSAQGFAAGREFSGPIVVSGQTVIPGGAPQYVLLDSEPVTLQVRMLPPEGELPGFKGAIGRLSSEGPMFLTNAVKVGEPLELFVTVRGDVNLTRLVPPDPPRTRGWQSFPPVNQGYVRTRVPTNSGVVFAFTFIPLSDDLKETPRIPYSAFDPESGKFVDLTIPSAPITVLPDAAMANLNDGAGEDDAPTISKPRLSGLATRRGGAMATLQPLQSHGWFVGVQVAPLFAFGGLWWWERRRRYLEQHPEILRRRRALRDLRRAKLKLRRAARAGAASDFSRCGVNALQIACAPHYPAESRALVCADVLNIMPPGDRDGAPGKIVRRLFAADATRFSGEAEPPEGLLELKPELDAVLVGLEARL